MDNLLEEIVLADQAGLDVFGIGEHHRSEFVDSAPPVILGAAATRTKNIRLTSAVTVLSAADPVRIFQEFATLDLISHGRAEIVAGRGSSIEAFPLFGFDLDDYDSPFSEKLELLLKIRENTHVRWTGDTARLNLADAIACSMMLRRFSGLAVTYLSKSVYRRRLLSSMPVRRRALSR
jgi:alkanesulfonate monooxygenase SsuD/methylene tetrahydromethanopterin reductase-like flavin-dependent oxidoreductase (luciferase family)